MNDQRLLYLSHYGKIDGLYRDNDAYIILIRRLPHPVNTYTESFVNAQVVDVNGVPIHRMQDLLTAFKAPIRGFHVIRFAGINDPLVLDAGILESVQQDILTQYGVPAPYNINPGVTE
jgi:hypothetical protein